MTPAHKVTMAGLLAAAAMIGSLGVLLNHGHRALLAARRDAEAAHLALAHQVVAQEETRRELQGTVSDLLTKNAELRAAYESARAAAPGAKPVAAARLDTGPLDLVPVQPEPEPVGPPMPPTCATGEILYSDGAGSFYCKSPGSFAHESAIPPVDPATCVLKSTDRLSVSVEEITLLTKPGNYLLAGTADVYRVEPRTKLASGRFQSALSDTSALAQPNPPRWGVELDGLCQRAGCGLGASALLPPVALFGWRAEGRVGAMLGPDPAITGGIGLRF